MSTTRRKSDLFGLATLPPLASVSLRKSRRLSDIGLLKSSTTVVVAAAVDLSFPATAASDEKLRNRDDGSSRSTDSLAAPCESLQTTRTATTPVDDNCVQKKNVAKNDDDDSKDSSSVSSSHKQGDVVDTTDDLPTSHSSAAAAVVASSSSSFAPSSSGHQRPPQMSQQPQSSSYFLQGIDFERCQDVMSLPDPPGTPADNDTAPVAVVVGGPPFRSSSSTTHILRRMSSPLVRPLRDSTNNELSVGGMDDSKVTTRKKKKRTRKTMFELSSSSSASSSSAVAAIGTFSSAAASNNNNELPSSSVETTSTNSSFSKRRKKRQSIVLPSDAAETMEMEIEEDEESSPTSTDFIQTFSTFKKESSSSPSSTWAKDDVARIPSKPDAKILAKLRRLVHDYTDLPKSARAGSNEAKTIREMTGYSLTSTPVVDANNNDNDNDELDTGNMSRQEKFALLHGMETDLRRLDATKVLDAQIVATVTQCRVQKVRNNGSFRYFLDQTGQQVSPREYEMRYMRMLQQINRLRSQAWSSYFDQLEQDNFWKTTVVVPLTPENRDEPSDDDASGKDCGSADGPSSSSPAAGFPIDEEQPVEISSQGDAQSNNTSSPQQQHVSPSTIVKQQAVRQADEEAPVEMDVVVDDANAVLALFVPPHPATPVFSEEHDDDPEMARAVRKLHETMDRALATYAEEVMAIQAARALKGTGT